MVTDSVIGPICTVFAVWFSTVTVFFAWTPSCTLPKPRLVGETVTGAPTKFAVPLSGADMVTVVAALVALATLPVHLENK